MYEYHNNKLSIPAHLLYDDWGLISYNQYKKWSNTSTNNTNRRLIRTQSAHRGQVAFVSFYDMPLDLQNEAIRRLGDPEEMERSDFLIKHILPNKDAMNFFNEHRKPDGNRLSDKIRRERTTNCEILDAIGRVLADYGLTTKMFGKQKLGWWKALSKIVNSLPRKQYPHTLPGNYRWLEKRYEDYLKIGFGTFIHGGEGGQNALIIKGDIADWILSMYALPIKHTVADVWMLYETRREHMGWPSLTEQAIYHWLNADVERVRIWSVGRKDKETYNNQFKHTLKRDKDSYFPNVYWAIDGSKCDWIHFQEDASNKMGAKLIYNIMFDVYSEKIIGYSLSFSENMVDHFHVMKMAVETAGCRPYYFTYDNQSGHKTQQMQELYSSLVAKEKGLHCPHRAYSHSNPAEALFNRFQKQVINKFWWNDGQGVKVRRDDNRVNFDFIKEHKHLLKTVDELHVAFDYAIDMWNQGINPNLEMTRNEAYRQPMPVREELDLFDIMNKMWLVETKGSIYKAEGITIRVGKQTLTYEVYDDNGNIDLDFRLKNVGKRFVVRYSPDFLDGYISLCDKDAKGDIFEIAVAQPKRAHNIIPIIADEKAKEQWAKDEAIKQIEYKRDLQLLEDLRRRTQITPDRMIEQQEFNIKHKQHLSKEQRSVVESEENFSFDAM